LGVNTLLQGRDASDIDVDATIAFRPELLGAAGVGLVGDGANAAALASAGRNPSSNLSGINPFDFYNQIVARLGVTTASAANTAESSQSAANALQQQRASLSGVNLDEEAVELIRFERAFQGSARFTTIIDQLLGELLSIIR
jgi:flagellar hook-associated protein 1 FlgK